MRLKTDKIFYGWWVVAACFLIALYTGGVVFYGFTAVFEPIAQYFGWSYAKISFAASLRGLEMGILAPLIGILFDRWGPRRLLIGGVAITTAGLLLLSRVTSLGMFYAAFVFMAIGTSTCSTSVFMPAIANWFRKKVGLATGIMLSGYGFSGLLIPPIVKVIDLYGWQLAMAIFAVGMLVLCLPLSLLVRHKPEQYGYQPDGEASGETPTNHQAVLAASSEINIRAREALRNHTFWQLALALLCQMLILTAVVTHIMPYLSTLGFTRGGASLIASAIPLISIAGRLGLGWLGDRADKRWVMAAAFVMVSLGLLCFGFMSPRNTGLLVSFLVLFGIGYGGNNTLRASMLREYFGRSEFGTIHGAVLGIMELGSIAGPPLAGYVFDTRGSYQPIWLAFMGLSLASLLFIVTLPSTRRRPAD